MQRFFDSADAPQGCARLREQNDMTYFLADSVSSRAIKEDKASLINVFKTWLNTPLSILPLVIFRIGFGVLMFASTVRFIARGWVSEFYLVPQFHFTYLGFGWIQPLPGVWMYAALGLIALCSLFITLGLFLPRQHHLFLFALHLR